MNNNATSATQNASVVRTSFAHIPHLLSYTICTLFGAQTACFGLVLGSKHPDRDATAKQYQLTLRRSRIHSFVASDSPFLHALHVTQLTSDLGPQATLSTPQTTVAPGIRALLSKTDTPDLGR